MARTLRRAERRLGASGGANVRFDDGRPQFGETRLDRKVRPREIVTRPDVAIEIHQLRYTATDAEDFESASAGLFDQRSGQAERIVKHRLGSAAGSRGEGPSGDDLAAGNIDQAAGDLGPSDVDADGERGAFRRAHDLRATVPSAAARSKRRRDFWQA